MDDAFETAFNFILNVALNYVVDDQIIQTRSRTPATSKLMVFLMVVDGFQVVTFQTL